MVCEYTKVSDRTHYNPYPQVREAELLELRADLEQRETTIKHMQEQLTEAEKARSRDQGEKMGHLHTEMQDPTFQ